MDHSSTPTGTVQKRPFDSSDPPTEPIPKRSHINGENSTDDLNGAFASTARLDDSDDMDAILGDMDMDAGVNSAVTASALPDASAAMLHDDDDDLADVMSDMVKRLDLSGWIRCRIETIERSAGAVHLTVHPIATATCPATAFASDVGRCTLLGCWTSTPIESGDIVSIQAHWSAQLDTYCVDSDRGYLIVCPDELISGTTVTGSVFCQRKATLADRYPGVDGTNRVMFVGTLVHQLLQACIGRHAAGELMRRPQIELTAEQILNSSEMVLALFETGMTGPELREELAKFVPRIEQFIERFLRRKEDEDEQAGATWPKASVHGQKSSGVGSSGEFDECIAQVMDIEENLWIPTMGLKGKVDVTTMVRRRMPTAGGVSSLEIMPLEVKTGKPSFSAEHRGQVTLYQMMMAETGRPVKSGLLLYLRDGLMKEVKVTRNDQRDLIMLRNQIAHHIAHNVGTVIDIDPKDPARSEAVQAARRQFGRRVRNTFTVAPLPEPIHHHSACQTCAYNTICCALLKREPAAYDELQRNPAHPLHRVSAQAVAHLSESHVDYFVHWSGLLALEENHNRCDNSISTMWTEAPESRECRHKALIDQYIVSRPIADFDRFSHVFTSSQITTDGSNYLAFNVNDYLRVSTRSRFAVSAGRVTAVSASSIAVSLERDLTKLYPRERFILDNVQSNSLIRFNTANLGKLLEDTDQTNRLRSLLIDRTPPNFSAHPVSEVQATVVSSAGKSLLDQLNAEQRSAVLLALRSNDYMLLRGLPGTGKTQTIAVLVLILSMSKQRVLITSHTHSAVDTMLTRIVAIMPNVSKILRLGDETRTAPLLQQYSHLQQLKGCTTPDELRQRYDEYCIVGVTCLGANHPMLAQSMFDVCIVDEATQALQSTVLRPLFAARRFVLIGDPDQLPPIVRSRQARQMGADQSLFARLDDGSASQACVMLTQQYRMNNAITELANSLTYGGKLKCGSDRVATKTLFLMRVSHTRQQLCQHVAHKHEHQLRHTPQNDWLMRALDPAMRHSVVLLNTGNAFERSERFAAEVAVRPATAARRAATEATDDTGKRKEKWRLYENYCEAGVIADLVAVLQRERVALEHIGVIAPFSAQVEVLRRVLHKDVEVNTVDQFQGRDKQVIVLSCTKSDNPAVRRTAIEQAQAIEGDILSDLRRLTVAVTRAKVKLIIVCDVESLKCYEPFARLFRSIGALQSLLLRDNLLCFCWESIMIDLRLKWMHFGGGK